MSGLETLSQCRVCRSEDLELVLDLGEQPLADGLVASADEAQHAARYPLRLALCRQCHLLQLLEVPDPDILFGRGFPYFSSVTADLVRHAGELVEDIIKRQPLSADSMVVELASNDGYLLQHVRDQGIGVLGIDPASGPANAAREAGIETLERFFDRSMGEELAASGRQADVVIANNVLAHVPDPVNFLEGVRTLLKPGGLVVMEVAWGRSLLVGRAFDTIYHEHHCYFTANSLSELFKRAGLAIEAIEPLRVHGGSLRIRARHEARMDESTEALIEREHREGLFHTVAWKTLADSLDGLRQELIEFLEDEKKRGRQLAAYGAAAKGTMLLNWAGLDSTTLAWVADANPHKQGRFIPGTDLEVVSPKRIEQDRPDRILLLPWNWAEEIARQQKSWTDGGGRFIVPLPEPHYL